MCIIIRVQKCKLLMGHSVEHMKGKNRHIPLESDRRCANNMQTSSMADGLTLLAPTNGNIGQILF